MLSIKNVSIEQASTYYQKDNYYTKERGEFFGKSKELLGFGELTHESFIKMLNGQNEKGEQLRREKETGNTRAGYDHTFTAPKSLSILLEIAEAKGDVVLAQTLRNIHDKAVNTALNHIESNYIQTRTRTAEGRIKETTGNMIAAKFEHDTSRELDPTLHTHCVIANYTQDKNGNWKSLSNEELYDNKMSNGLYYRSELAASLKEIGYELEITDTKKGLFELKEIDESLINEFSKRKKQIDELMPAMREKYSKASETELRQFATMESRKAKKEVDRDGIYKENLARAEELVNTNELLEKFQIQEQALENDKNKINDLIEKSAAILNEQESIFSKEKIMEVAGKLSLGSVRASDIFNKIENSSLVKLDDNIFTTKEMISIEKNIIVDLYKTQNTVSQMTDENKINKFIDDKFATMTKGQKDALKLVTTTKDSIVGIQGDAGTGKTFMMQALNQFADKEKFELIGLAFTGKAAGELEEQSGIKSTTLHSYLLKKPNTSEKEKIYLVDEASLVGSNQTAELIAKSKEENARIVFIGDTKQFTSISAGGIFQQLQNHGMSTANMNEALRQKTQILKDVVKAINTNNTDKAFELLEKEKANFIETNNISSQVFEEWKQNKDALIISSTNKTRNEVNNLIRGHLNFKTQEILAIREGAKLMDVEQFFAQNYKKDQVIFIQKNIKGFKPGEEAIITSIDTKNQTITVTKGEENAKEQTIDVSQFGDRIQAFNKTKKEFGIGEKIMFTKNDKKLDVKNGETALISNIAKNGDLTVKIGEKEITFNSKTYNYFDYGYATTDYKAQGATADNVIIAANAEMASKNSFYVQITRAKHGVKVITDDIEKLKEKVTIADSKTSTLEYLKELTNQIKQDTRELAELKEIQEQNVDLEQIVDEIKKEKQHATLTTNTLTNGIDARISQTANRDIETANEHIRNARNNLKEADDSTFERSVSERLDEREFALDNTNQREMRDLIDKILSNQKEIKSQIKNHEEFADKYLTKQESHSLHQTR